MSGTGDAVQGVALVVWVFERTGSAGWVAAVATLRLLPYVLFSSLGGVVADRYDRRRLMVTCDLLRGAVVAVLAVVAAADGPVGIGIALAFVTCACTTPYRPAVAAATPRVVGEDDLAAANAVEAAAFQVTWFLGPAAAAGLLAAGSPEFAFVVNAVSFLVAAGLVARVTSASTLDGDSTALAAGDEAATESLSAQLRTGVDAIRSSPAVLALMGVIAAVLFAFGVEIVLQVLVATERLGLRSNSIGYLTAFIGLGGIVAAPFTGRLASGRRVGLILVIASLFQCVPLVLLSLVSWPAVACALMFVEGAGAITFEVLGLTLMQRFVAGDVRGRVFGIQDSVLAGAQLLGSAIAPVLVAGLGLRLALVVGGGATAACIGALAPRVVAAGGRVIAPDVLARVDVLSGLGLLQGAARPTLERIATALIEQTVAAGDVVIAEGDKPDDLFVVRAGSFEAVSTSEAGGTPARVNSFEPDDWFGEIGLVEGVPRTATVRATTDARVWRVPGDGFLEALGSAPVFPDALRRGIVGRLALSHPSHIVRAGTGEVSAP